MSAKPEVIQPIKLGQVPTLAELIAHVDANFHVCNGQLVPNKPVPLIIDYLSIHSRSPQK